MPDPYKSLRQDMQSKSTDELSMAECHYFFLTLSPIVPVVLIYLPIEDWYILKGILSLCDLQT